MEHEVDGTIPKELIQRLEDLEKRRRSGTFQPTALRSEYREGCWRLAVTYCYPHSSEKPSAKADVKNSQISKMIMMIDHYDYSMTEIGKILRRVLETNGNLLSFTSVKDHLLTLVWKKGKDCDTQTSLGLRDTNGSPNLCQKTRPYNNQQQKRWEFAILWT